MAPSRPTPICKILGPAEPAAFASVNPRFEESVRASFARQGIMGHLGAALTVVLPGHCEIELPYRSELSQQDGFFHAGVSAAIADSAGGYAALTLFEPGQEVLSVEFKINFIEPAKGERLTACARILRSGGRLSTCECSVFVQTGAQIKRCALMLQTVARVRA